MRFGLIEFLTLAGSLGLIIYGMKAMSEGLQKAAGHRMRKAVEVMTANRFLGVFTGFITTVLIQLSSVTSVMVVSFVNAGLLSLRQSITVLMGANIGTTITALLPALFATVAPPGSMNVPTTIGAIAFGITIIAALAAWSSRETYRVHLNDLGDRDAVPVPKPEYDRMRAQTIADAAATA